VTDPSVIDEPELLTEAVTIYCNVFLESEDSGGVEMVLDILTRAEGTAKANVKVFRSKLLWKLDRPDESVECMLAVIDPNDHQHALEAMELMGKVVGRIDQLPQQTTDFLKFMKNCQIVARHCERISLTIRGLIPARMARLYLAEISVFAANQNRQELLEVDKLLNDLSEQDLSDNVDYIRCRARLLFARGEFEGAARLWARIADRRKSESARPDRRSRQWWRAKYYELHCWSKVPQMDQGSIVHTIEVLENTYTAIPPLWAKRLSSLKEELR
jgi:hypothetical protein